MWGIPGMPCAGHFDVRGPPRMPFGGSCGGRGTGRPLNPWRLRKLLAQMQESCGDEQNSNAENTETNEDGNKEDCEKNGDDSNMEDKETEDKQQRGCNRERHARNECVFGPPHFGRPRFMRRLRRLLSQMEDTTGNSSDSDSDQPQETPKEEKTRDSEEKKVPMKECRQAWRRFMRRQMHGCPRHAFYGGRPQQAWLPPWASPDPRCPSRGRPMVPPPMLHKLRQLLTAMEAETGPQPEDGQDQAKINDENNHEASDSTHRLQTRLRRLIDHIENQGEDDFPFFPPHPGMLRMQRGPGYWMMPGCHRRRVMKRMRKTHRGHAGFSDGNRSGQDIEEPENTKPDAEDISTVTTNQEPLEDWQDLRQDVEDLEAAQGVPLVDASEACPTCGCLTTV